MVNTPFVFTPASLPTRAARKSALAGAWLPNRNPVSTGPVFLRPFSLPDQSAGCGSVILCGEFGSNKKNHGGMRSARICRDVVSARI